MKPNNQQSSKPRRGFAAMDPEKQKEIAKKGGRAAHEQGVAHQWDSEEARKAGKKGGLSRKSADRRDDMPLL
jgi:general stress protein YciG